MCDMHDVAGSTLVRVFFFFLEIFDMYNFGYYSYTDESVSEGQQHNNSKHIVRLLQAYNNDLKCK